MNHEYLLLAQQNRPMWFYPLIGLIGLIMIAIGSYGIKRGRAVVGRRQMLGLRLFGITEPTGKVGLFISGSQCAVGCLLLLLIVVGPFIEGTLKEKPAAKVAANPQIAPNPQAAANRQAADNRQIVANPQSADRPSEQSKKSEEEISPFENPRSVVIAGSERGERYADVAPAGGYLIGLRCAKGTNWGGAIQALQPIYQVDNRDVLGQRHGKPGGEESELRAKPGYAVGAIHARVGLVCNALRLVFYRIDKDRLDPEDQYESPWIGCNGGDAFLIDGRGAPITEVFGTWQDDIVAVGLKPVELKDDSKQLAAPRAKSDPVVTPAANDITTAPPMPMRAGREDGQPFEDAAPDGGVLVGLRCAKGKNWGGALHAVQPIYQVGAEYKLGQRYGKTGGEEVQLLAKPGYAVGAIHARAGLVLNAVQLSFYRIDGVRLDRNDHYETAWFGSDGGGAFDLDAQGDPITGVFGTWADDIISLGCTRTSSVLAPLPIAEGKPPRGKAAKSNAHAFRKWTSADGKSTVEAKMLSKTKDSVRLERRDGKFVNVPFSQLSAQDLDHLKVSE
jgi:hypothetical protein